MLIQPGKAFFPCVCAAAQFLLMAASAASFGDLPRSSDSPDPHSLPIFYDPALAAQGFPSPLVKATIAGHEALFIVDTGASVNTLADWFTEDAGIPSNSTNSIAEGSAGKTSAIRVAHEVYGRFSDGHSLALDEAIVVEFPPVFKSLHLGGLLSPQLLAPVGMATLLDLRTPSLRFLTFQSAVSELRRVEPSTAPLSVTPACRNETSKFVNRLYLTSVSIPGSTDLVLVDTGATKTTFSEKSKIGRAVEGRSEPGPRSEGVGGPMGAGRLVRNVKLLLGGRMVELNPSIGKVSASCDSAGILGMDALRNCFLILGGRKMAFSCD
jgi:Aspartyl protease